MNTGLAINKRANQRARRAFLISGSAVFLILVVIFVLSYVVVPLLYYESVAIPESCVSNHSGFPPEFNYFLPGVGTGTIVANDSSSVVVVFVNYDNSSFNSTLYLVNKSDNEIELSMRFNNNILGGAISNGALYLFNNKIGYIINTVNGKQVRNVIETDNYRGLYTSKNSSYIQTNVELSALNVNGSVISHLKLNFRSIAYGCLFQ